VTLNADTSVEARFNGTAFTTSGGWSCANNVSCQDVYDVNFPSNATVTLTVGSISAESVVRLAAFAPGTPLTGNNLLTGLSFDRQCAVRGAGDVVSFRTTTAGTYRISIGRDWQKSSGASGTYGLTIASDAGLTFVQQSLDDAATGATGLQCGYTFVASNTWVCPVGVSCQDVYDFTTLAPTPITVAVTAVTGPSIVRMAVFNGSALNTTNLLNGNTADRRCVGPDQSDSATSTLLPSVLHRIAVGRDGASFPGSGLGMYRVTITTPSTPLVPGGQTSYDTPTQLSNTTCP
jgi:hypothetical protein